MKLVVGGTVKWYDADAGCGVITSPQITGDCFVHFSSIEMPGYRELRAGQQVHLTYEALDFLQDGCPNRALTVWPQP